MNNEKLEKFMKEGWIPVNADFSLPEVGSRIREVRKFWKLNQEEFGKPLGVSRIAIYNIEQGRSRPSTTFMRCLYFVYHADLEYIAFGSRLNHSAAVVLNSNHQQDFNEVFKDLNGLERSVLYSLAQLLASTHNQK